MRSLESCFGDCKTISKNTKEINRKPEGVEYQIKAIQPNTTESLVAGVKELMKKQENK